MKSCSTSSTLVRGVIWNKVKKNSTGVYIVPYTEIADFRKSIPKMLDRNCNKVDSIIKHCSLTLYLILKVILK